MKNRIIKISLAVLMILSVLWIIWLSLTPLIDRDGTRFHLPFAKLWAENGFMYFRKWWAYYDLNMLNLNYLYMLVFKFGISDQFTKIIHASFLLAGAYLIFRYFREKYRFNWAALSFIMYCTVPIHQRLAAEVYVDLGLLFFSTLSVIYFIKWLECDLENRKHLIISALGAGLGFGTKYNGVIFAFFMTLFVALVISRKKKDDKLAIKSMLIYGAVIFISVLPWLLRNYINSGNPFFPIFRSVFPSTITSPAEIMENVGSETAWRMVAENENFFTLIFLPVRVFFQGADHDLLKFDGVLNPLLILLLPFLFWPKIKDIKYKNTLYYLFAIFLIVYLSTLYGNNIRIRYFMPVLPILIILNIEAIKNLLSSKKFPYFAHTAVFMFLSINLLYSSHLYNNLHLKEYNPFSSGSKQTYLERYLVLYDFFEYINKNTPKSSVIYEAFTGGRSYYINRTFYSDTTSLDRYFLELAKNGADAEEYALHLKNLPNSDLSATHLLIRANSFIQTFYDVNYDEVDTLNVGNSKKIKGYFNYLNGLKLLKERDGTYLFEILSENN